MKTRGGHKASCEGSISFDSHEFQWVSILFSSGARENMETWGQTETWGRETWGQTGRFGINLRETVAEFECRSSGVRKRPSLSSVFPSVISERAKHGHDAFATQAKESCPYKS